MPTLCLTRRKTQLELLARLCDGRCRAVVSPPAASAASGEVATRFLALESDGVLLEWPLSRVDDAVIVDATVTVLFDYDGQAFTFRTETYGRVWWTCPERGPVAAWKLRLPLRIDERSRRRHNRMPFAELDDIAAAFTSVADPTRRFTARLRNFSAGGLEAVAIGGGDVPVQPGGSYWVQFVLPGDDPALEFVVRVAHTHPQPRDGTVVFGCTFCPGDDPALRRRGFERIEQFVSRRRCAETAASQPPSGRGE